MGNSASNNNSGSINNESASTDESIALRRQPINSSDQAISNGAELEPDDPDLAFSPSYRPGVQSLIRHSTAGSSDPTEIQFIDPDDVIDFDAESEFDHTKPSVDHEHPWGGPGQGGSATYLPGIDDDGDSVDSAISENYEKSSSMLAEPLLTPNPAVEPHRIRTRTRSNADPSTLSSSSASAASHVPAHSTAKLGEWFATAIAGNDITSNCLYVTGLCIAEAGIFTPICLIFVAIMLYLFRNIYGEAVTALPLNGGAYNVLLNTTSKSTAAIAACLTILSYVATCVVSASIAISYLRYLWPELDQTIGTIVLISSFAFLNLLGMSESAVVAFSIFIFHIFTLSTLVLICIIYLFSHMEESNEIGNYNWDCHFNSNSQCKFQNNVIKSLIFGFSQGSLGVSGFETSANFVEEQQTGVFVKTLRNMWSIVAFFNPVIAILSMFIMRIDDVALNYKENLLAQMAQRVGGNWKFDYILSADAFLVLSGAVLTSYVGVVGLARRLSLDRCMPQILLSQNRWRKTNHIIIIGFCLITISMYLILDGDTKSLANVYSVSFLSVMGLFCLGDMLLKYKRSFLYRQVKASWNSLFIALLLVCLALAGLLASDASVLLVWAIYFVCTGLIIMIMFFRIQSLKILYSMVKYISKKLNISKKNRNHQNNNNNNVINENNNNTVIPVNNNNNNNNNNSTVIQYHNNNNNNSYINKFLISIANTIKEISSQQIIFFVKHGALSVLNKAVLYVRQNEDCSYIRIIHVYSDKNKIPIKLHRNVQILDETYPKVKIDLLLVKGNFGPQVVNYCSHTLNIPHNLIFITCPSSNFVHKLESLGGVRLITH